MPLPSSSSNVATLDYDISIEVTADDAPVDTAALLDLAHRVMAGEDLADGMGMSILVTDDDEVRSLNHQFLGNDETTDVLSFPDESDDFVEGSGIAPYLGDIAISLPMAIRQAATVGHDLAAELDHLLVHGILHLCGYDHVNSPEEEAHMRARENHYLGEHTHHH